MEILLAATVFCTGSALLIISIVIVWIRQQEDVTAPREIFWNVAGVQSVIIAAGSMTLAVVRYGQTGEVDPLTGLLGVSWPLAVLTVLIIGGR